MSLKRKLKRQTEIKEKKQESMKRRFWYARTLEIQNKKYGNYAIRQNKNFSIELILDDTVIAINNNIHKPLNDRQLHSILNKFIHEKHIRGKENE